MSVARARTQYTARSGVQRANHEANAASILSKSFGKSYTYLRAVNARPEFVFFNLKNRVEI